MCVKMVTAYNLFDTQGDCFAAYKSCLRRPMRCWLYLAKIYLQNNEYNVQLIYGNI